ncbi:MAG: zinc ribbon domain-containing protein [Clostridia bacterium]|nr:zinc ribbon domain-containing protein [Clostridia bacterium]
MYCVNCGAKLENTEKICPLCGTRTYHPDITVDVNNAQYPEGRVPKIKHRSKTLNGAIIILFLIPVIISFLADFRLDGDIDWFGYVLGALIMGYTVFALPLWFEKPNPVIFLPCVFGEMAGYLLYVNCITGGDWFLSLALPVTLGVGLIAEAALTLLYYLKKGKLYIWGGVFIFAGGIVVLVEFLVSTTFGIAFRGWSLFPLVALILLGGLLIYLAISKSAREVMERKLFF